MRNIIEKMDQHYIVCGFGRMGEKVCESLEKRNISFVVIDQQRTKIDICNERGWPNICGDVTDDDVLHKAKVSNASGMAIAEEGDDFTWTFYPSEAVGKISFITAAKMMPNQFKT